MCAVVITLVVVFNFVLGHLVLPSIFDVAAWEVACEGQVLMLRSLVSLDAKLYTPSTLNIQMKLILLWVWAELKLP